MCKTQPGLYCPKLPEASEGPQDILYFIHSMACIFLCVNISEIIEASDHQITHRQ